MGKWRDRFRFKRWGKWMVLGVVGFIVLSTVAVEVTSSNRFCNSCHIMEPFYTSWKAGSHKEVDCVSCHIAPGVQNFMAAKLNGLGQVVDDVLARTSNKPSASVSDFSCTRSGCHTQETLKLKQTDNGRYRFNHEKHLGTKHLGVEISCTTCHSHVKGETHFEVNTAVCLTCHLVGEPVAGTQMGAGKAEKIILLAARTGLSKNVPAVNPGEKIPPASCTTCHDAPKKEIEFQGLKFNHSQFLAFGASCESCHQGTTATPPPIEDGRCLECHNFGVERVTDSREMHKAHSLGRHKVECSSCHGTIRHGLKVQTASIEKLDCTKCHLEQHDVQQNTYFNLAKSPHSADSAATKNVMFMAHVDCTGCHTKARPPTARPDGGALVLAASADSCDKCHQPGLGKQMIPLWQKTTHELYDGIEALYQTAIKTPGTTPETLAQVKKILDGVRSDGSWGVHNPKYTQQMLADAKAMLAPVGKAIAPAAPAAPNDSKPAEPKPAEPKPVSPGSSPAPAPAPTQPGAPR